MIENGQVETLIVKDLSRLGREYLRVGYYTEIYLPQKGVRFIAVNDAGDFLVASSTDFNPIPNRANVPRTPVRRCALSSGCRPSMVNAMAAKHRMAIRSVPPTARRSDEETTPIVKHIFELCAGGKGPSQIARILANERMLTPARYYCRKHGKGQAGMDMQRPYGWSSTSAGHILANQTCRGHIHLQKSSAISCKNSRFRFLPFLP